MKNNTTQFIGDSQCIQAVLAHVNLLAPLNKPALIVGERGTGKELIAARLHYLSKRWEEPFIKINCAAITESLLETELFGHEAGAFTGAIKQHFGHFESAKHGTVFLDELASTSLRLQEKLLRVIEYGEFQRVGSNVMQKTNARIVAASNVDLPTLVEQNKFRADLLDRLAFDVITLPPLRERGEDTIALAEHFALGMARELQWPHFPGFTESVIQTLLQYSWPGNIRELKNVVERAIYKWPDHETPINQVSFNPFSSPYCLKSKPTTTENKTSSTENALPSITAHGSLKKCVAQFETNLIETALRKHHYHQRTTANYLGLSYHALRAHLKKYQIKRNP